MEIVSAVDLKNTNNVQSKFQDAHWEKVKAKTIDNFNSYKQFLNTFGPTNSIFIYELKTDNKDIANKHAEYLRTLFEGEKGYKVVVDLKYEVVGPSWGLSMADITYRFLLIV